jgi:protein-histidine pros-kinase
MDDYLSKPISPEALDGVLARWLPAAPEVAGTQAPPAAARARGARQGGPGPGPALDLEVALASMGGDAKLLRETAALWLEEAPRFLAALRGAVAAGDARALQRAGHTVKGSSGLFGAEATVAAAQAVEDIGRNGDLAAAATACAVLEGELMRLTRALAALAQGDGVCAS